MKLKGALSQIRPTEEQREKIYGDILNKLSERPLEKEKKETKIVMKRRKLATYVVAAAAAVAVAGGSVYAVSPEVRESVNNILGINRQSTEEYYEIQNAWGNSSAGIEVIGDALTVTENDFTEFAEGIRAKLVGVVNNGTSAELILEFEFDEPVKNYEYILEDVSISAFPKYLHSYSYGLLNATEGNKVYETVRLEDIENIPKDMTITIEIKTLDKANSKGMHDTDETCADDPSVKIHGNFSADFKIGTPIKSYSANIEPAEISWTHYRMGGETARMEITALKYSPKKISVDLRMLEDFLVIHNDEYGGVQYFNNTQMFCDSIMGNEKAMPLKLKMSDGSLKDVLYYNVDSNAVNDIDKNTLVTDMDWIKASWDIYSDKPTTVTFEIAGIVDYTDVEAIVFCGKEFPITERNFGINAALS
ncbi:MAG: hypothetical protein K2J11_11950 [Oscillospiraceae bacterium]|nr:hypothetical protein [Oscillospiraceae bacterium]